MRPTAFALTIPQMGYGRAYGVRIAGLFVAVAYRYSGRHGGHLLSPADSPVLWPYAGVLQHCYNRQRISDGHGCVLFAYSEV